MPCHLCPGSPGKYACACMQSQIWTHNCVHAYISQHVSYAHICVWLWPHILFIHRCFRSKVFETVSQNHPFSFKKFSQAFGAEVPKRTNPVLSWSGHTGRLDSLPPAWVTGHVGGFNMQEGEGFNPLSWKPESSGKYPMHMVLNGPRTLRGGCVSPCLLSTGTSCPSACPLVLWSEG